MYAGQNIESPVLGEEKFSDLLLRNHRAFSAYSHKKLGIFGSFSAYGHKKYGFLEFFRPIAIKVSGNVEINARLIVQIYQDLLNVNV